MDMAAAGKFILDTILEKKEVKGFGNEWFSAAFDWVKSWFLKPEDAKTTERLTNPAKSEEYKADIIADKLEELKDNPEFMKELAVKLGELETQRAKRVMSIKNVNMEVDGNFHQGDNGLAPSSDVDNIKMIEGGTIKVGGNFQQGDNYQQAQTIVNYHVQGAAPQPGTAPLPPLTVKTKLPAAAYQQIAALIGNGSTENGLAFLQSQLLPDDYDVRAQVTQLQNRVSKVERNERMGTISHSDARTDRNQITAALLELVNLLRG